MSVVNLLLSSIIYSVLIRCLPIISNYQIFSKMTLTSAMKFALFISIVFILLNPAVHGNPFQIIPGLFQQQEYYNYYQPNNIFRALNYQRYAQRSSSTFVPICFFLIITCISDGLLLFLLIKFFFIKNLAIFFRISVIQELVLLIGNSQ